MMFERLPAHLLVIALPFMVTTVVLTGCGKNQSGTSSEQSERPCRHLADEPRQEQANDKKQGPSKNKKEKKKKCKKCSRNKCICHDNHEEYDAMMEYRSFDLK